MYSIAVEIEHKKYAQLIRSDGPSTGKLDLTTLVDFQKRAVVRLFLFRPNKPKVLIKEIVLDRLPQRHAGDIRIVLTGELTGGKRLALTLRYGGQTIHSSVVPLQGHIRSAAAWIILSAALAAAVVILFVTLYPRGTDGPHGGLVGVAGTEETAAEEKAPAEPEDGTAGPDPSEEERPPVLDEAPDDEPEALPPRQPAVEPVTETVTVYFEPNRSRIIDEARETLDALVRLLEEFEEITVRIEGHCALKGSEQGRIELSDERSAAVRRYLLDRGWTPDGAVEVEGYGGRRPATLSEEDQYLNRRVEVTVTYLP